MTDKLTNGQIIKALEEYLQKCQNIKYGARQKILVDADFLKAILDLINRQKAELDQLAKKYHELQIEKDELFAEAERYLHSIKLLEKDVADARAELKQFKEMYVDKVANMAIKHFAEKVKRVIINNTYNDFDKDGKAVCIWNADGYKDIDNLVKEMVGDE